MVAFAVILLLAGVLIERRLLTPHAMLDAAEHARRPGMEAGLPELRRIVLDPCTGLEKTIVGARTAKAD